MSQRFKVVCRGSRLSLAQAAIFAKKVEAFDPGLGIDIVVKETRGDVNQTISLQEIEGKDFFTKDIQDYLLSGQADFAVHSLKDVSGERFFDSTHYAIIDRDDPRDAALLTPAGFAKLRSGSALVFGTSSPRRAEMSMRFLQNALPSFGRRSTIVASDIRGNVDTRLRKAMDGHYDGVILACAGLNRLLRSVYRHEILELLAGMHTMILPLIECPPAPGQGAIVAETDPANLAAVKLLQALNNPGWVEEVDRERKIAHVYGSGCHQKFGVVFIQQEKQGFVHAAGKDRSGKEFAMDFGGGGLPVTRQVPVTPKAGDRFLLDHNVSLVTDDDSGYGLAATGQRIWVNATDDWFRLSRLGVWVEGSVEGLGLTLIKNTIASPLLNRADVLENHIGK